MQNDREHAAKKALGDIRWLLNSQDKAEEFGDGDSYLDGPTVCALLRKNFGKLDPDNDGITRKELITALGNHESYSEDEYEMLRLITKYFDTVINLSEDEDGPEETKISVNDLDVLEQFLLHGKFSMKELHKWCNIGNKNGGVESVGPPPMTGR